MASGSKARDRQIESPTAASANRRKRRAHLRARRIIADRRRPPSPAGRR